VRTDAEQRIARSRLVHCCRLGVGEERVRPPDAVEHVVVDAQFAVVARPGEVQSRVVPVLTEIEVHREVLRQALIRKSLFTDER